MSDLTIGVEEFRRGVLFAGRRVSAARDELCRLDAIAGDGDLGVTLAIGFGHIERVLSEAVASDAGALLRTSGLQMARNAPSTIGALLGSAFLQMARGLDGTHGLDVNHVARMLEVAAHSVAERGGAEPGQRTVLDAMSEAAVDARLAAVEALGPREALSRGAAGAARGAAATAEMQPVHGRAGWIANRARGQQDAGALAWALYLDALAEGVKYDQAASGDLPIDSKEPGNDLEAGERGCAADQSQPRRHSG